MPERSAAAIRPSAFHRSRRAVAGLILAASGCLPLSACTTTTQLSAELTEVNRQVAEHKNQALLLNILRRSMGRPLHFTAVSIVRGNSRLAAGADLALSVGSNVPTTLDIGPNVTGEERSSFEASPLDKQEFYRALLAPLQVRSIDSYLQRGYPPEMVLSLAIERVLVVTPGSESLYMNDPDRPETFKAFQSALGGFLDQGFTTESIDIVRDVGPPIDGGAPPGIDQLISVHKEGLTVEEIAVGQGGGDAPRRFQVRQLIPAARFCFAAPNEPLFERAQCARVGSVAPRRSAMDPALFGAVEGSMAVFDGGAAGRIEIRVRSLAEVLDYLGALTRVSLQPGADPIAGATRSGRRLFVIRPGQSFEPALAEVRMEGERYAVPAGPEGGWSGAALTMVSELLAEAQSVRDLPTSNAVTIIGE